MKTDLDTVMRKPDCLTVSLPHHSKEPSHLQITSFSTLTSGFDVD